MSSRVVCVEPLSKRTLGLLDAVFCRLRFCRVFGDRILRGRGFGFRIVCGKRKGAALVRDSGDRVCGQKGWCRHMDVLVGAVALLDGVSAILNSIFRENIVIIRAKAARLNKYYKLEGQPTVQTLEKAEDAKRCKRCRRRRSCCSTKRGVLCLEEQVIKMIQLGIRRSEYAAGHPD